jgi:DNA modification methylase
MSFYHIDDIPADLKEFFEPAPQLGLEKSPDEFIANMVEVFSLARRALREDGTLWLNIGDSYASAYACSRVSKVGNGSPDEATTRPNRISGVLKEKDLCMIPWRLALALQADGWWMRSVICWHKRSPMPESVTDRPTSSWEPIFLLAKSERYYYDAVAVAEPAVYAGTEQSFGSASKAAREIGKPPHGNERPDAPPVVMKATRNLRNVWTLSSEPFKEAHFAVFPSEIPHRAIAAGTSERGCCAECGAPRERATEKTAEIQANAKGSRFDQGKTADRTGGDRAQAGERFTTKTTGWQPACACNAAVVPCRVLEPFAGSGTTLLEAIRMGRDVTGIELNPEYCRMIENRISREAGLFAMTGAS